MQLDGVSLHQRPSKEVARILALLPQGPVAPEGIAVADLVATAATRTSAASRRGAAATTRRSPRRSTRPRRRISPTAPWNELSGGQRQHVWIAMALAQQTDILLLDEPTTFLDVARQIEVLDLLTDLNRAHGTTIVMVLHDVNLGTLRGPARCRARWATCTPGRPKDVICDELVREVFGLDCCVIVDPVSGAPLVLPRGRHHVTSGVHGRPVRQRPDTPTTPDP